MDHFLGKETGFLGRAAIKTVSLPVFRLVMATRIEAVDLNLAGQFRRVRVLNFRANGLAQLVRQYERRLILAIQITAELQRAVAFGPVREAV